MGICCSKNEFSGKKVNEKFVNPNSPINFIDSNLYDVCPSVCKIIYGIKKGSGFLISLNLNDAQVFFLMTNEHIITDSMVKNKETIEVKYDNEKKIIKIILNEKERFIQNFNYLFIDCTIVEIMPKDDINERYFLLPNIDYINNFNALKNEEIYIPQFPKGEKLGYSKGIIHNIEDNLFSHTANTLPGSSGSPIFLMNTNKVIGLHKGSDEEGNFNFGYFIFPIMKSLKNFVINSSINISLNSKINISLDNDYDNFNYILAEFYTETNENLQVINSYENCCREFNEKINNKYKNEDFIKQIKIQINNKNMPFNYRFKLNKGKHVIKYIIRDIKKLTQLNFLFYNCSKITNLDFSHFNSENVIDTSFMFSFCKSLSNLNLSNFNTKNVTNMKFMFAQCESLIYINLFSFNTQKVVSMGYMFHFCKSLTNLNLSNFNTENVTNMENMFCLCKSLISLKISYFDTRNVTNMKAMFCGCESLTSIYLFNFDTQNVTNMN